MGEILLGALVAVSFAVSAAMEFTKRRIVRRAPHAEPRVLPARRHTIRTVRPAVAAG